MSGWSGEVQAGPRGVVFGQPPVVRDDPAAPRITLGTMRDPVAGYHDVVVIVNGIRYRPAGDYSLELTLCKVAGWRLWRHPIAARASAGSAELVGGEYDGGAFRIEVAGITICDSTVRHPDEDPADG